MTTEEFMELARKRTEKCLSLLEGKKNVEYTRNNDKLHNLKAAAKMIGTSPERALLGMWSKHLVSIVDIVNDLDKGTLPEEAILAEKITDSINYLLLLEGLLAERGKPLMLHDNGTVIHPSNSSTYNLEIKDSYFSPEPPY